MNNIFKSANVKALLVNEEELLKINKMTIKELKAEDVYVFKLLLCSNEVDRDMESFTPQILHQLSEMYRGKTVIYDHFPSAKNQIARIYDSSVVVDGTKKTRLSEDYTYIEAKVYMLNIPTNSDLISEIDAGIKKEVSVGVSAKKRKCSICNAEHYGCSRIMPCGHAIGNEYEEKLCCIRLDEAVDAYEASFVAVPAQTDAGTKKKYDMDDDIPPDQPLPNNTAKNTMFKCLSKALLKNMEE